MAYVSTYKEFPFCQVEDRADLPVAELVAPELGSLPAGSYPVEVSYGKLFEWIWRVKSWRLTYDVAFDVETLERVIDGTDWEVTVRGAAAGYFIMSCTNLGYDPVTDPLAVTERSLICASSGLQFSGGNVHATGIEVEWNPASLYNPGMPSNPYEDPYAGAGATLTIGANEPRWKRHEDLYLPEIKLSFSVLSGSYVTSGLLVDTEAAENTTIDIEGDSCPARKSGLPADYGWPGVLGATTLTVNDLSLTPEEWWEHDPDDGDGPVWDSATGAQLRNPWGIQR